MINIVPTRLHWIKDDGNDNPSDLCAHSPVLLEVDGMQLVTPDDGDATVSTSAIYLLRTLERDHTESNPVGEHMFPCCGHSMYDTGEQDVIIIGCPNGSNVFVTHNDDSIRLIPTNGTTIEVSFDAWRQAVVHFCDAVEAFYDRSLPKTPSDAVERDGFKKKEEWRRRRQLAGD